MACFIVEFMSGTDVLINELIKIQNNPNAKLELKYEDEVVNMVQPFP